ncbi:MAG TPA: HlyD family efflux transporter periplasmic adaptor subunit, partial [Acidimicrobiales bacterium]|nr:HlyD family efflux transporter periplasmic adaptor subunit [Acidimicrobiales bacterium]
MPSFFTRRRLAAASVVVVVIGGAVAAASARSESSPSYRTTRAGMEDVDQELHTVGSVEPVSQASVSFPVAGTVAGVDVAVGEEVTVGSRLAALDVADLTVTLHEKQAALDQASLVLQMALDGEDVSGLASGGGPANGTFGRPAAGGANAELKAAQQAVLHAQKAVDEAAAAAGLAYANAVSVCRPATVPTAIEEGSTTTTTTTATDSSQACLDALQAVLGAQAQVAAAQAQLTDAVDALRTLLDETANRPSTPTTTTSSPPSIPSGGSSSNDGGSSPSGSPGSNGSSGLPSGGTGASSSPSAEDLVAHQKAVDAAEDEVAVAQQAIDQATVVSPIDGRIASVNLQVGDEVEAASSTADIIVVGEGGFDVTTSVSVKDLPDLEVGQAATVKPDGVDAAVGGEVVGIGVTADATGSSYPVTIGLTGDTSAMGNGSTASVVIVTSAAEQALAVATSAVT